MACTCYSKIVVEYYDGGSCGQSMQNILHVNNVDTDDRCDEHESKI